MLNRDTALLIGLDASGFDVSPDGYRLSRLVPGIDARRVRELGGTGGKIMVYLQADQPEANEHNIAILRQCIADFGKEDLLLVVEFLTYQLEGESLEDYTAKIPSLVEEGTRISLECGAKVLKLPYPGTPEACASDHQHGRRGAVGGAVGRRQPRDLPRPGRDRDAERRLGRHRRPLAVEGLHLARP